MQESELGERGVLDEGADEGLRDGDDVLVVEAAVDPVVGVGGGGTVDVVVDVGGGLGLAGGGGGSCLLGEWKFCGILTFRIT